MKMICSLLKGFPSFTVDHFYLLPVPNLYFFSFSSPNAPKILLYLVFRDTCLVFCFTPCPRNDQGGFPWIFHPLSGVYGQDQTHNRNNKKTGIVFAATEISLV